MNKIVTLLVIGKPMEDLGDQIMDETEIPPLGCYIPLDEGDEMFIPKFAVEDEENHKVNLYGEIKLTEDIPNLGEYHSIKQLSDE